MKIQALLASFCFVFILFSCGDDEVTIAGEENRNYFPLMEDNYWIYETVMESAQGGNTSTDSTYIANKQIIDGKEYREWVNVQRLFALGDTVLVNQSDNDLLVKTKSLNVGIGDPIELPPVRFIKGGSTPGSLIYDDMVELDLPTVPVPDQNGVSGTIAPKLTVMVKNTHLQSHDSIRLNADRDYENVYETKAELKIKVDLNLALTFNGVPVTLTHTLIPEQQYGEIHNYFADEIGLARSEYTYKIEEVNTEVQVPVLGTFDLSQFGVDPEQIIANARVNGVAELVRYELN